MVLASLFLCRTETQETLLLLILHVGDGSSLIVDVFFQIYVRAKSVLTHMADV